uniref:Heat shock factor binding protein 1 n=1 Tax=Alexandrium monilatum TaxID=311494 RepID=A0A7S4VIA5_9DINO
MAQEQLCSRVGRLAAPGVGGCPPSVVAAMEGGQADEQQDLTLFVQNLLKEMQGRFQTMSDSIINRIDDMGSRIDDLEKSISELIQEAGVEDGAAGAGATASGSLARPSA